MGGAGLPWTPSLQVGAATLVLVAAGLAVELHGGGLGPAGRAMAGAGVHAGFLGLGWVIEIGRASCRERV